MVLLEAPHPAVVWGGEHTPHLRQGPPRPRDPTANYTASGHQCDVLNGACRSVQGSLGPPGLFTNGDPPHTPALTEGERRGSLVTGDTAAAQGCAECVSGRGAA